MQPDLIDHILIKGYHPFKHMVKELNVNGETFRYFDIGAFEQLGKFSFLFLMKKIQGRILIHLFTD